MARMRSLAVIAAFAAALFAACGSGAVSPPSASSPRPLPSRSAPPSLASSSPRASESPGPSAAVQLPHEATDLEALLPDQVDGKTLTKLSNGPLASLGNAGAQPLRDATKQIGDGSGNWGLAYAGDPEGKFNLFALQIHGAETSKLLTTFTQLTLAETVGGRAEAAELGGRSLVHIVDPVSDIGDVWFYGEGDTLFGVQAGSPAQATKLLALIT